MWDMLLSIIMIVVGVIGLVLVLIVIYVYFIKGESEYNKAKKEIIPFIESYRKRVSGNNRFVVTQESLQDSFREYDIETIKKVWMDLIEMKLIEKDVMDGEWCIR